jgi:putative PIN family toxin of toxin-antitoxin system
MTRIVLDTNILVSAIKTFGGKPWQISQAAIRGDFQVFYNEDIFWEYVKVLNYEKHNFLNVEKAEYLGGIILNGDYNVPPESNFFMRDETDRIFYDTAKNISAYLITGNTRHFPQETFILTPAQFLEMLHPAP